MIKTCSRCGLVKEATREYFSPLKKARDGLHSACKPCLAKARRDDRKNNPERYSELERLRHEKSGDERRAANRKRWGERSEQYLSATKERREARREAYNSARRERLEASASLREERARAHSAWMEVNRDAVNERRRERWKSVPKKDRLRTYMGAAISRAVRRGGKLGLSWQQAVGYSVDDLRAHLERQFERGMSWDNYGDWHIDHIIPASSFKYGTVDDPDFRACWALTNLRPLWARENIRKRDKRVLLL